MKFYVIAQSQYLPYFRAKIWLQKNSQLWRVFVNPFRAQK